MISEPDRRKTVELIETAREAGARLIPACQILEIKVVMKVSKAVTFWLEYHKAHS
jgi:hypothetical protein